MTGAILERAGLRAATLRLRHKRFLAEVDFDDGTAATAHCTNTGSMRSCWEPGDRVLLEASPNPARKLPWTWLACRRDGAWVGVDTGMPNRVVAEAARRNLLPGLPGLVEVRTEVRYGLEGSRIDLHARDRQGREVFVEVKNCTLREGDLGLFPDAVTTRGTKHLRELREMVRQGHRAALAVFVQRGDVGAFRAAAAIDPVYAGELDRAADAGVEVLPLRVDLRAEAAADGSWTLGWALPGLLPWAR